jgi:hypothetical protein
MSRIPKTVHKNPVKNSTINNKKTVVGEEKKCKSLMLPNRVYMEKNGRVYVFPIYHDSDVGIDSENGGFVIDLKVDEDCESTNSIVNYGVQLCRKDLNNYLIDNQ